MGKTAIVGGGFSAFSVSKSIDCAHEILTPYICPAGVSQFQSNKLMSRNCGTNLTLCLESQRIRLHDRVILGGNSKIWGGFIDVELTHPMALENLKAYGVEVIKLGIDETGSTSNRVQICQLQRNGRILDVSELLRVDFDEHIDNFYLSGSNIVLKSSVSGFAKKYEKVYLCVGILQLIEILVNAKLILDEDVISLEEFEHKLSFHLGSPYIFDLNYDGCVIRYGLARAVSHYIGYQKRMIKDLMPLWVDQVFSGVKSTVNFIYNHGRLIPIEEVNFGGSVHYCNLKVNGVRVQDLLSLKFPNVFVVGMAAVDQAISGPISNDILNLAWSLK